MTEGNLAVTGETNLNGSLNVNGTIRTYITSCTEALETDASGNIVCGTDASWYGGSEFSDHILPSLANAYDLGSSSKAFRNAYLGPDGFFVNDKNVISDDGGTITFSTDYNQNINVKTSGTGNVQVSATGTGDIEMTAGGVIQVKKTLQILDGQKITSSGGTMVVVGNNLQAEGSLRGFSLTLDGINTISASELNVLDGGISSIDGFSLSLGVTTLTVEDEMVKYASDNVADAVDMGWYGKYIEGSVTRYSGMFRDATDNKMRFFTSTQVEPSTTVNVTATGYTKANVVAGDIDFTSGTMRGHIIPDTEDAYDIGSAEFKIRDIFVSENLRAKRFIGDGSQLTGIATNEALENLRAEKDAELQALKQEIELLKEAIAKL